MARAQSQKTDNKKRLLPAVGLIFGGLALGSASKIAYDELRLPAFASVPRPNHFNDLVLSNGQITPATELTLRLAATLSTDNARTVREIRGLMQDYRNLRPDAFSKPSSIGGLDSFERAKEFENYRAIFRDNINIRLQSLTESIDRDWAMLGRTALKRTEFHGYNRSVFEAVKQASQRECGLIMRITMYHTCPGPIPFVRQVF